jgi:hypothetical protein
MTTTAKRRVMLWATGGLLLAVAAAGLVVALASRAERRYVEVDLKALGFFPLDPYHDSDAEIPKQFRRLDGRRVVMDGEMYNPYGGNAVDDFQLVYSRSGRRFEIPKVQERVFAVAPDGQEVPYFSVPVRVWGVLHVGVQRDNDGRISSVYRMNVHGVAPWTATGDGDLLADLIEHPVASALTLFTTLAVMASLGYVVRLAFRRHRLLTRPQCGVCPACGYDLRGSRHASRCPECGRPVDAPAAARAPTRVPDPEMSEGPA